MRRNACFALLLLILSGFIFTQSAQAQTEPTEALQLCPRFGEEWVRVVVDLPSSKFLAGSLVPVKTTFTNETNQTLAGGSVLVRLVSRSLSDAPASAEGVAMMRLVALDDVDLPAKASLEREFSLSLSSALPRGSYDLQVIYVLSGEMNLESPDSDMMISTGANLAVRGIAIENDSDVPFAFVDTKTAGVSEDDPSEVSAIVRSVSDKTLDVSLFWKVYAWNSISDKAVVESKAELVRLSPGARKTVSYQVKDNDHSFYQVVLQADAEGMRSFASTPVEGTIGETLIKLAGVVPASDGSAHAYVCGYNVFSDDATEALVRLSLSDKGGSIVGEGVFPAPRGVNDFEVSKAVRVSGDFTLLASVMSSGSIVQEVSRNYSCDNLGLCSESGADLNNQLFALTLLAAGTGGLIAMRYLIRHVRKGAPSRNNIPNA